MKQAKVTVPWKPLHVWFIGDIQWHGDSKSVAVDHLKRTITRALEDEAQGHTVRFIGMGDYIDFASPSNRSRLKSANLYDTALDVIDQKAMDLVDQVYEFLKPTKGKWLGMVEGHHFHELKDGTTTDMRLCEMLGAPLFNAEDGFFGTTGLINVMFRRETSEQHTSIAIWFAHGCGNGQTGYYPLMKLEKKAAEWEQVDVFAMGHTTKMCLEFQNKVYPRWAPAIDQAHRKVTLIGTGGYSKTYVLGAKQGRIPRGGYAEQKMLNAAIIGSPVLHVRPFKTTQGGHQHQVIGIDVTAEG